MQLNKVLKGLMIALPVMAIAACSSNKNASNDGSEGMLGAGTGMDANGGNGNMSSEEQARLQCNSCSRTISFTLIWTSTISVLTSLKCWMHTQTSCVATVLQSHRRRSRGRTWYSEYNISTGNVVRTLLRCICRVEAFLLTRSPSFLTVKKTCSTGS